MFGARRPFSAAAAAKSACLLVAAQTLLVGSSARCCVFRPLDIGDGGACNRMNVKNNEKRGVRVNCERQILRLNKPTTSRKLKSKGQMQLLSSTLVFFALESIGDNQHKFILKHV